MENTGFHDRRMFERFPVELPLKYLDLNSRKEGHAHTVDVSANGMGLITGKELSAAAPLDIWLIIPDNGSPIYTKAEVVWSHPLEDNRYRVGIKLEKPELMGLSRVLRHIDSNHSNYA